MATQALSTTTNSKTAPIDLKDSTSNYQAMVVGAGNGSVVTFDAAANFYFLNTTGGAAVYTMIRKTIPAFTEYGDTTPDTTLSVATTDLVRFKPDQQYVSGDQVTIECSVIGHILYMKD